jgi:signal transduction histidine kinase
VSSTTAAALTELFAAREPGLSEERLRWLVRLRWLAMAGVLLATGVAAAGALPSARVGVLLGAVAVGVAYNLYFRAGLGPGRAGRLQHALWQALPDTAALTGVLWASGGVHNPFVGLYSLHVVLAGILAGPRAALVTAVAALGGLAGLRAAATGAFGAPPRWDPPAAWDDALAVLAPAVTLASAAYLIIHVMQELRRTRDHAHMRARMLELTLERVDAGVEVVEADGRVAWRNARAAELQGATAAAGDHWRCPGEGGRCEADAGPCPFATAAVSGADGGPVACRFAVTRPGGDERIYERVALPIGARTMNLYLDRTRQMIADRQMLFAERLASLGRAVQGVAHELNTPLASVQTLAADCGAAIDALTPHLTNETISDLKESVALIVEETRRCRRITHALLARADVAGAAPAMLLSAVAARARAVVDAGRETGVPIEVDVAPDADVPVAGDAMMQILVNLVQNAVDATAAAGGRRVVLRAEAGDGQVRVTVRDEGAGVAPEIRPRLFEPFTTTKPPGVGTGLGLYTAWVLARDMGARIGLTDRDDGRGACAFVELPRGRPDERAAAHG